MTPQVFPVPFESPSGLSAQVNANGAIRRIDHRDVILNLFLGSEIEGGPANVYLRRHGAAIDSVPLLGPRSPAVICVDEHGLTVRGEWNDIAFTLSLTLARSAPAWLWRGTLENKGKAAVLVDLVYAQDLALAAYGAVRMNEYYVSEYVDYTPLSHSRCGHVLAVRQNLSMGGRNPWAVIGSLRRAVSFATDALDFHGLATRAGENAAGLSLPVLAGRRRQHEHSMAVIQDAPLRLEPATPIDYGFFGWFEEHHAAASSPADLTFVDRALGVAEAEDRPPSRVERDGVAADAFQRAADLEEPGSHRGGDHRPVWPRLAPRRARGWRDSVLLRRRRARRAQGEGAESSPPARAHHP